MFKRNFPVVSIILYVLGILFLAFSIWSAVYSINLVNTMIDQGQVMFQGSEFEIVSFLMGNFGQFLVYSIVLLALGWVVQIITPYDDDLFEISDHYDEEDDDYEDEDFEDDDFEDDDFEEEALEVE